MWPYLPSDRDELRAVEAQVGWADPGLRWVSYEVVWGDVGLSERLDRYGDGDGNGDVGGKEMRGVK